MYPYASEDDFSEDFVAMLRKRKAFVQRIESAMTGKGVPDVWFCTPTSGVWVELKNMKRISVYQEYWKIDWREGQQAWALSHKSASMKHTYTVVAFKDGYAVIPMTRLYVKYHVHQAWTMRCTEIADLFDI